MPQLSKNTEVAQFFLPTTKTAPDADKAWVKLEVGAVTAGDLIGLNDDTGAIEATVKLLATRIKEWNFTEADGQPVPITEATVRRLDMEDFGYLASKVKTDVATLSDEQKKT